MITRCRNLFASIGPLRISFRLAFLLTATFSLAGCEVESMWIVPYPPGERPSPLWSSDPRTQGWKDVEVEYSLLGEGIVDADVHSTDRRHHFTARGNYWNEDLGQESQKGWKNQRFILTVEFNGKQEHYRFEYRPNVYRGIIIVIPSGSTANTLNSNNTSSK